MSLLIYINLKTCNRNLRKYFLCLSSDGNILVFFLWFRMNYKEVIFAYDTTKRSNSVSNVSRLVDARIMKNLDLDGVDTKSRKMSRVTYTLVKAYRWLWWMNWGHLDQVHLGHRCTVDAYYGRKMKIKWKLKVCNAFVNYFTVIQGVPNWMGNVLIAGSRRLLRCNHKDNLAGY